jgi:purine-binding chemotaxis protein CheW
VTQSTPHIIFLVAETTYGISTEFVQQMEMLEQITRVPNAPAYVDGVVYLRGQVVPVINLRSRFGRERIAYDIRARLIVVNLGGRVVGLAVDAAREYLAIPDDLILPPPAALNEDGTGFIAGVASLKDRLVMILDVAQVVTSAETERLRLAA